MKNNNSNEHSQRMRETDDASDDSSVQSDVSFEDKRAPKKHLSPGKVSRKQHGSAALDPEESGIEGGSDSASDDSDNESEYDTVTSGEKETREEEPISKRNHKKQTSMKNWSSISSDESSPSSSEDDYHKYKPYKAKTKKKSKRKVIGESDTDTDSEFKAIGRTSREVEFKAFRKSKYKGSLITFKVSSENEVDEWLKKMLKNMDKMGLGHCVPNKEGRYDYNTWSKVSMDLLGVFKYCISSEDYPQWMRDIKRRYEDNNEFLTEVMINYNWRKQPNYIWSTIFQLRKHESDFNKSNIRKKGHNTMKIIDIFRENRGVLTPESLLQYILKSEIKEVDPRLKHLYQFSVTSMDYIQPDELYLLIRKEMNLVSEEDEKKKRSGHKHKSGNKSNGLNDKHSRPNKDHKTNKYQGYSNKYNNFNKSKYPYYKKRDEEEQASDNELRQD